MVRKFAWDPDHWRFRAEEARTVADQMTHEEARTIMRRIANDYDRLAKLAEEQTSIRKEELDEKLREARLIALPWPHSSLQSVPEGDRAKGNWRPIVMGWTPVR